MAAPPIPTTIDQITPGWLTENAGKALGGTVTAIEPTQIGAGVGVSSALYRLALTYEPADAGPETVVVKLPALDPAAQFTSTALRMYEREVRFYTEIAETCPARVPRHYYGDSEPDAGQFVLVIEDLGELRVVDQLEGCELADAQTAVDCLGEWHGHWWGREDELEAMDAAMSLGDPIYPAVLPAVFDEGWAKTTAAMPVAASIADVGPRFAAAIEGLMARLSTSPQTFIHGDYRADNMLFDADGGLALVDFQLGGIGVGAYDLAYFTTQSLLPDVRATHERELFDRYVAGVTAAGAEPVDADRVWDDYRHAALFCLVYPIVASRGMDLNNPREYKLVDAMNSRLAGAVADLDLAELI